MQLIKKGTNELIACLSTFIFILPKFLIVNNPSLSFVILLLYIIFLFVLLFVSNFFKQQKIIFGRPLLFIVITFLFLFIDIAFRYNSLSSKYLYEFFIFVFLPFIFISNIHSINYFLEWFCFISIINFLIYSTDPLNAYQYTGDYMFYGFNVAYPCFIGSFLGFFYFKKKWTIPFVIISFVTVVFFSNRSALLSSFLFVIFYFLIFTKNLKRIIIISFIPFFIVYNYVSSNLLQIISNLNIYLLEVIKYKSYALEKFINYLKFSDSADFYSNRLTIWNQSAQIIFENLFFGSGLASYENKFGIYSHNLIIDIVYFFGAFILIIVICKIFKIFFFLKNSSNQAKLIGLLFFILWFPKLLFSSYFTKDLFFFLFLFIGSFNFINSDVK